MGLFSSNGHSYKNVRRKKSFWGNDQVVRKHYNNSFFSTGRTVTTYKKDWLGRTKAVTRKARWWE